MKKILFLFALLLAVLAQAQESDKAQQVKYTVKGVSKENGKTVYLEDKLTSKVVDSVVVAKGKFVFKGVADKDAIFAITFDENFAQATGVNTAFFNLLIAVVVAVIIVLAMNLVGALLVSALVVFPALSAMRVFKSFFAVTVAAAIISVVCSLVGILAAILAGTPVGSTIVAADIVAFGSFYLMSLIQSKEA